MSNFGRYQIMRELGRGGMGVVYQCYDPQLKRYVALKIVNETLGDEEHRRFEREAHMMAKLNHPHIIKIFDIGEDQRRHFITMELVEGQSFDKLFNESLPLPHLIQILIKVAGAVHYAHQQGVIHRDLKPSNIMVHRDGEPRVMDFGLAKEIGGTAEQLVKNPFNEPLSKNIQVVGTPEYMAPEQANGKTKEIDARSDIYALGMVLYRLLAGRLPFSTHDTINVIYQIIFHEPKPPSHYDRTIPRDLEAICLKAIEKEKTRRYQNALALAEDLQRYLDGKPVLAQPVTAWVRGLKWVRRHRVLSFLGAAASLLLLVLTAGFVYQNHRQAHIEHRLRQVAEQEKKEALAQRKIAEEQKKTAVAKEEEARHSAVEAKLSQAEAELVLARTALDSQNYFQVREAQKKAQQLLLEAQVSLAESMAADLNPQLRPLSEKLAQRQHILFMAATHLKDYCLAGFPKERKEMAFQAADTSKTSAPYLVVHFPLPYHLYTPVQPSWRYHLLSRNDKKFMVLWDARECREIVSLPPISLHSIRVASFSPDDAWLAVGDAKGKVTLYEIASGKTYEQYIANDEQKYTDIRTLRFSANASLVLAATSDCTVIWKLPQVTQLLCYPLGGKKIIAAFSRNSKWLALSGLENKLSIFLLDLENSGQKPITLPYPTNSLCFGPEDKFLLIGDVNDIRIWPFNNTLEKETIALIGAHRGRIRELALSEDDSLFASLGQDGRVVVWSTYNYRKIWEGPVEGSLAGRLSLSFHQSLPRIGVWNSLINLYGWDLNLSHRLDLLNHKDGLAQTGRGNLMKMMRRSSIIRNQGHTQVALCFSPDTSYLICYAAPSLYRWEMASGALHHLHTHFPAYQFQYMGFSSDGSLLLWRRREQTIVWHMPEQRQLLCLSGDDSRGSLCLQPWTNLLVGDSDNRLCFYSIAGEKLRLAHEIRIDAFNPRRGFDATGTHMALSLHDKIIQVWDITSEKLQLLSSQELSTQGEIEHSICFALPGFLAFGTQNGEFFIYDWQKQNIHHKMNLYDPIRSICFDPQRRLYWIQTQNGLILYPHLDDPSAIGRLDRIYPMPVLAGYPIVALGISSDFRHLALGLQSCEIIVLSFGE
jgi:WD40 repeat protein/predicted Ser/Thr protein kinase